MYKLMTPGPTQVRENVLNARAQSRTNPDIDPDFFNFYQETCQLISSLLNTKNETLILAGEGILGLEAACASLTEPGDRVLVIDNGVFGKGFADFASLYGAEPVLFSTDYYQPVNPDDLRAFLKQDSNFKYATLVHCDTPSGILNDINELCPILKEFGILSVVDSVSGTFGEPVYVDDSQIDILCGGSQKVVSAPPGLTFVTVSPEAKTAMKERETPIASFYANLLMFENYFKNQWFPYTMPIHDIYGLRQAMDNIKQDKEIFKRHQSIAKATRAAFESAGLQLFLQTGHSSTVTVVSVPEQTTVPAILDRMKKEHNIMIAGSFDFLDGQVLRIGHMGENANKADMVATLEALQETLTFLNVPLNSQLASVFQATLEELS